MSQYHKINTVFKRDMNLKNKPLVRWEWSESEFQYLGSTQWEWQEKMDGTNIRVIINEDNTSEFRGKTDKATTFTQHPKLASRLCDIFVKEIIDKVFPLEVEERNIVLYGEGIGGKIQKGSKYSQDEDFVLFDVRIGKWWLRKPDVDDIAKQFGIKSAPILGYGTLLEAIEFVESDYCRSYFGDFIAEGVVCRPLVGLLNRAGGRIITKIKHKDFQNVV